jgi:hypothetical protein
MSQPARPAVTGPMPARSAATATRLQISARLPVSDRTTIHPATATLKPGPGTRAQRNHKPGPPAPASQAGCHQSGQRPGAKPVRSGWVFIETHDGSVLGLAERLTSSIQTCWPFIVAFAPATRPAAHAQRECSAPGARSSASYPADRRSWVCQRTTSDPMGSDRQSVTRQDLPG